MNPSSADDHFLQAIGEGALYKMNPRGTYIKIADSLRQEIESDKNIEMAPSQSEIVRRYGVSRGVAIRALAELRSEGMIESVPGSRWRIVRNNCAEREKIIPLKERVLSVFAEDGLTVGDDFPSSTVLCERFGVSRPTVRRALDKLEAQGLLSAGSQGKVRTVLALPGQEGTAKP
jgi:DNA-binding GntR family transcriptional regulator